METNSTAQPEKISGTSHRSPWLFIPTLTFYQAVVNGMASILPGIVLKSLGASNEVVGFSSLLFLPVAFRFLFAPVVDGYSTKRRWTIHTQAVLLAVMVYLTVVVGLGLSALWGLVAGFLAMAFVSAFFDIAGDGMFLLALTNKEQAFFVGVKTACYRLATIFIAGGLVTFAGLLGEQYNSVALGWHYVFGILVVFCLLLYGYHFWALPYPRLDRPVHELVESPDNKIPYAHVFSEFLSQKQAWAIIAFILVYRFGEGLLDKMKVPFMLDGKEAGGMALSLSQVGIMQGTISVVAMILGGLIGAWMVKRYTLRRTIIPFAICMTLPNLAFAWLAHSPIYTLWDFWGIGINPWMQLVLVVEAFGYGLGFASYVFFMCEVSRGPYQTSFFAICAGLMSLGYIIPGTISGTLQAAVGYTNIFLLSILFSIPGIVLIRWLPLRELEAKSVQEDQEKLA